MFLLYTTLFGWLPTPLNVVCCGVFVIFMFIVLLRVIALILDVIPFV